MDSELSEEFEVKVGMHQGSVLSFNFAVVVDVVTELTRVGVLCQVLYADNLVVMSESIEELSDIFMKLKEDYDGWLF